jgi:DNA-binding MarR family transcriptional regulator
MAMSENSVKILNYLKENAGKNLTSADVAEALDLGKATVNGAFTAMQKKGLGVRVDAEVDGAVEVSFLTVTEEGKAADISEMGETVNKIITYLSATQDHTTLDDLAAAIGVEKRSVNGSFNALVKKGLCARTPAKVAAKVPVKYLALTDAGKAFDPTADAE